MARQTPKRIALHWAASNRIERAYHINILRDGKAKHLTAPTTRLPAHTRFRNTNTVAIGCLGMVGAYFENFGSSPLTLVQIESMCAEAASLAVKYKIPIDSDHIFTHCEAAFEDGYGPYQGDPNLRWDLMILEPTKGLNTADKCYRAAKATGDQLRGKIKWYAQRLRG